MKIRIILCAALSALFLWNMTAWTAQEGTGIQSALAEEPTAETASDMPASAQGERPEEYSPEWLEEKGLTLGESTVTYPALKEGTLPEPLRQSVNDRILADGDIRAYVTRISQLISGGKLTVAWQGTLLGPVFSFAVSAEGAVATLRSTHVWTGGNIDLRDGHEISLKEIFTDPEAAGERMEAYLEEEVAPVLSAHLLNSQVTPLPERFRLTERGIVWMYDVHQLSTLKDRAGDVLIPWQTVREWLNTAEDGILAAMGLRDRILSPEDLSEEERGETAARIRNAVAEGRIPGVPAALGDSVQALTDRWHLLTDPDVYQSGRLFSLEGAAFRDVFLMTDFLSESWDYSVVDGIRLDLGSFYGLTVGETSRTAWQRLLGEPEHTVDMDGETAEANRTVPGVRDYYTFGENRLVLHGDSEGVLTSVIVME